VFCLVHGLLHPVQVTLGNFLAWFLSLQLPSAQSESPLAPKSHVSFKVRLQLWRELFVFRSVLPDVRISDGLLYYPGICLKGLRRKSGGNLSGQRPTYEPATLRTHARRAIASANLVAWHALNRHTITKWTPTYGVSARLLVRKTELNTTKLCIAPVTHSLHRIRATGGSSRGTWRDIRHGSGFPLSDHHSTIATGSTSLQFCGRQSNRIQPRYVPVLIHVTLTCIHFSLLQI
jgi:hypothetical protein